jgi:hypothetical protein
MLTGGNGIITTTTNIPDAGFLEDVVASSAILLASSNGLARADRPANRSESTLASQVATYGY